MTETRKEKLELALWLIERHDALRSSVTNRAAMIISADAVIFASAAFLLDNFLTISGALSRYLSTLFLICFILTLLMAILSLAFSANAIVFIWTSTKNAVKVKDLPVILFFHPHDTTRNLKTFSEFKHEFLSMDTDIILNCAIGELQQIITAHQKRYRYLKLSIIMQLMSVVPLFFSFILIAILKIYI